MDATLKVTGMTCDACARHVEDALRNIAGVDSAEASFAEGPARVTMSNGRPLEEMAVARSKRG